jgi:hypothetical protein
MTSHHKHHLPKLAAQERAALRRQLLDRITVLNVQVRSCPDAELREMLEAVREELRRFDSEEPHQ